MLFTITNDDEKNYLFIIFIKIQLQIELGRAYRSKSNSNTLPLELYLQLPNHDIQQNNKQLTKMEFLSKMPI